MEMSAAWHPGGTARSPRPLLTESEVILHSERVTCLHVSLNLAFSGSNEIRMESNNLNILGVYIKSLCTYKESPNDSYTTFYTDLFTSLPSICPPSSRSLLLCDMNEIKGTVCADQSYSWTWNYPLLHNHDIIVNCDCTASLSVLIMLRAADAAHMAICCKHSSLRQFMTTFRILPYHWPIKQAFVKLD